MRVEVSDQTFKRLQVLAEPLIDTVEDVMVKLLDFYITHTEANAPPRAPLEAAGDPNSVRAVPIARPQTREALYGFRKELWELVVQKLNPTFSLHDVYEHMDPLVELRPHVQEMKATIRNAMQRLRDMGYVEFLDRGEYRRID